LRFFYGVMLNRPEIPERRLGSNGIGDDGVQLPAALVNLTSLNLGDTGAKNSSCYQVESLAEGVGPSANLL